MNVIDLIKTCADVYHPQNKEATQEVIRLTNECNRDFFESTLQAVLSTQSKEFRQSAALMAKNFLTSKYSSVQLIRAQVWKQFNKDDRQDIIQKLIEGLNESGNGYDQLLSQMILISDVTEGINIIDFVIKQATDSNSPDYRSSICKMMMNIYKNGLAFYTDQILNFIFDYLSKPQISNKSFSSLLNLTAKIAKGKLIPNEVTDSLMKFLQYLSANINENQKLIGLVFDIFENGIENIDIVNLQFDNQFVIEILIEFTYNFSHQFEIEESTLQYILGFLQRIFESPCTNVVYNTQYKFTVVQEVILPILEQARFYIDSNQYNSIISISQKLLSIIVKCSDQSFRVQFLDFYMNQQNVIELQKCRGHFNSLYSDENFVTTLCSFVIVLTSFVQHQENLNELLFEVIQEAFSQITCEQLTNVITQSSAALISFISNQQQQVLLNLSFSLLKNRQLNMAVQGAEISKFFCEVAENNALLLKDRLLDLFQCFYVEQEHKFDSKLVNIYKEQIVDKLFEYASRNNAELLQLVETICSRIVRIEIHTGQQVIDYQTALVSILHACVFHVVLECGQNRDTTQILKNIIEICQDNIEQLFLVNKVELDPLLEQYFCVFGAAMEMSSTSVQFIQFLVQKLGQIEQTEVFCALLHTLSVCIQFLTNDQRNVIFEQCMNCLYQTNDYVLPQVPSIVFIQKCVEHDVQVDTGRVTGFIAELRNNFVYIDLRITQDFYLISLLANLMQIMLEKHQFPVDDEAARECFQFFAFEVITAFTQRQANEECFMSVQYQNALNMLTKAFHDIEPMKQEIIQFIIKNKQLIINLTTWLRNVNMDVAAVEFETVFAVFLRNE